MLITNFSSHLYTVGSGPAWNAELAEPVSEFPKILLFSWFHMEAVGNQGDNMYRIVLLLMLFADPAARWSFDARRRAKKDFPTILPREISNLLHNLALVALTAQVIFVYASGGLFKAGGKPWQNGSAVYTPLMTERFGTWPILSDFFTHSSFMVAAISWGSIIIQIAFPFMLLTRPTRIIALFGIMSFHIGIGVLMGLPWFSLAMIGIDFIFIRDATWMRASDLLVGAFRDEADPPRATRTVATDSDETDPKTAASDEDASSPRPASYAK